MREAGSPRKSLSVRVEAWPIRGGFTISRGSKDEAVVVVVELGAGDATGRGECVPYARYGGTVAGVMQTIEGCAAQLARGLSRSGLQSLLPAGAARNALDCAFWDLEAKLSGRRAFALAGLPPPGPVETAFTISVAAPAVMAEAARDASRYPLLKLKLGGDGDEERLRAVRAAAPRARLIVDANEAWRPSELQRLLEAAKAVGVELIEQPLPAGDDEALEHVQRIVPVCADESVHDRTSLAKLAARYDAVNIKLDKTGGLTEALSMAKGAREMGIKIMIGSMVSTSLAMAPALLLAQDADWVDLDGPLLLERDRKPGLAYRSGTILPAPSELWG